MRRTRTGLALALLVVALLAACDRSSSSGDSPRPTGSPVWTPPAGTPTAEGYLPGDWPRFGYDPARSDVNPNETALTPSSVGRLHRLWQIEVPGVADSSPALLTALKLPDGATRDVLYVTSRDGRLLALDAASGAQLWARQPSGPKITHSSPAIDPSRRFVYAYGLDGYVHKYGAASGDEQRGGGWPAQITRMRDSEKESSSLNIANGYLYVTTSGYLGDNPPYQGHVVAIHLADGATHVFNSLCSDLTHLLVHSDCPDQDGNGIWARAGAVVDPATGNLFVVTGNGAFDASPSGRNWGDSVLELTADASRLLDTWTPATYQELDDSDADLGSTAPALFPKLPNSKTPYLMAQSGKDQILRLLNRQNLNGTGKPGAIGGELQTIDLGCGVFTQPVVWQESAAAAPWVFVATTCNLRAFQAETDASGATRLVERWTSDAQSSTPVLAGGILFGATDNALVALDPQDGHTLWSSDQDTAGGSIAAIHWESPIVAGSHVYCADESGHLTAYGL